MYLSIVLLLHSGNCLFQLMAPLVDDQVGGLLSRRKRQTSAGAPLIFVVNRQTPSNTKLFTVEQSEDERFVLETMCSCSKSESESESESKLEIFFHNCLRLTRRVQSQ